MNKIDTAQYAVAFGPVDMATAANDGDWVSLKNYNHLEAVLLKAAGAVGEPATLTLEQAKDVSGTGAKALPFQKVNVKNGADLQAIGTFSQVAPTTANTYALPAGNTQALVVVEVDAQELDVTNGFCCVRLRVADVGATAQLGAAFYRLSEPRFGGSPMPSAIVN